MPESIESSRFVSHRARMSGQFDSRKDLQSTKFEWRPYNSSWVLYEVCISVPFFMINNSHNFDLSKSIIGMWYKKCCNKNYILEQLNSSVYFTCGYILSICIWILMYFLREVSIIFMLSIIVTKRAWLKILISLKII